MTEHRRQRIEDARKMAQNPFVQDLDRIYSGGDAIARGIVARQQAGIPMLTEGPRGINQVEFLQKYPELIERAKKDLVSQKEFTQSTIRNIQEKIDTRAGRKFGHGGIVMPKKFFYGGVNLDDNNSAFSGLQNYASGGHVPAFVMPGEMIVDRNTVSRHRTILETMNRGGSVSFANGGLVPGR